MSQSPKQTTYDEDSANFSKSTLRNIRRIILKWGAENYKNFTWRNPSEPWHALIAEILLQRTKAVAAADVYTNFILTFPLPSDLAAASVDDIERIIYPIGLRWRAPLLKNLGIKLEALGGKLPHSISELKGLPGVGDYAAAAWLGWHGGQRAVIVDVNIVRLLCRLLDRPMNGETRRKRWLIQLANEFTPIRNFKAYNYAVLDLSMEICTQIPKCNICPIGAKYCGYRRRILKDAILK